MAARKQYLASNETDNKLSLWFHQNWGFGSRVFHTKLQTNKEFDTIVDSGADDNLPDTIGSLRAEVTCKDTAIPPLGIACSETFLT